MLMICGHLISIYTGSAGFRLSYGANGGMSTFITFQLAGHHYAKTKEVSY